MQQHDHPCRGGYAAWFVQVYLAWRLHGTAADLLALCHHVCWSCVTGQYKYGWHAMPRDFKCGTTKIVSGRASCDYGIRRRSIDAFSVSRRHTPMHTRSRPACSVLAACHTASLRQRDACWACTHTHHMVMLRACCSAVAVLLRPQASPSTPSSRGKSLDIPGKHHSHGTGSTTPGRYVPPHAAGGFYSRQRATSLDSGHWGSHHPVSASLPSPQAGHTFGGRRRTSENNGHNGSAAAHAGGAHASKEHSPRQQQQQQHHAAKPAPNPSVAAAAVPASHAPAAAAKAAAAALAAAAAATSALSPAPPASSSKEGVSAPLHVAIPAGAAANALSPGSDVSGAGAAGSEASTPMSGGADMASPHRRRRRHRSRKHKATGSTADGSVDAAGASSDTESQISTSTHDSANSAPTAVAATSNPAARAAPAAGEGKPKSSPVAVPTGGRRKSEAVSTGKAGHQGKPAAHSAGAAHEKPHRRSHQPNKQHHQQPQQQWQPKAKQPDVVPDAAEQRRSSSGNGFKRNGSCGELAALGSSPTPRPVLQVAPQGLAC